ncbi:MAG: hypothetical protein ACE5E7_16950 [Anaerolineae bacterium]
MALRQYWKLFLRRWPLVVVPVVIVLGVGLATYQAPPPLYNVGVRFIIGQEPAADAARSDQERYYNWTASEYIVNGLNDWVRGNRFAALVSQELAQKGLEVPSGVIQGSLAADNARSMLTISLSHSDPDVLAAMIEAVATVLTEQNAKALPQLGGKTAVLVQIDEPVINQLPAGIRGQLDLPLRVGLALVAGLALALLVEYLDPTIRDRDELEAMGLNVLGEVPKR